MNSIELTTYKWVWQINNARDPYRDCYKIGGVLGQAVANKSVSEELLNFLFTTEKVSEMRKVYLAKGYLCWRFNQSACQTVIKYAGDCLPFKQSISFAALFNPLRDCALRFVVPEMNPAYLETYVKAEPLLFRKLWPYVAECRKKTQLSEIKPILQLSIEKNRKLFGIKKIFTTLSNEELFEWASGSLKRPILMYAPNSAAYEQDSEHHIVSTIVKKIFEEDLIRFWEVIATTWSEDRLKGDGSLGMAFLTALRERALLKKSEEVGKLIFRVDKVVNALLYSVIESTEAELLVLLDRFGFSLSF